MYQRLFRSMADEVLQSVKPRPEEGEELGAGQDVGGATLSTSTVASSSSASTEYSSSPTKTEELQREAPPLSPLPRPPSATPPNTKAVLMAKSASCEQLGNSFQSGSVGGGVCGRSNPSAQPFDKKVRSLSEQSSQVSSELTNHSRSASSRDLSCEQHQGDLREKVVELTRQLGVLTAQLSDLQVKIDTMNDCFLSSGWSQHRPHPPAQYTDSQKFLASFTLAQVRNRTGTGM